MKKITLLFVLAGLTVSTSRAELRVPSSVFTMEEIEEAMAEAQEEEEPLIFVYTDPGST